MTKYSDSGCTFAPQTNNRNKSRKSEKSKDSNTANLECRNIRSIKLQEQRAAKENKLDSEYTFKPQISLKSMQI